MKLTDPFFKGYTPTEVIAGKLYKYIIVVRGRPCRRAQKKAGTGSEVPRLLPRLKRGRNVYANSMILMHFKRVEKGFFRNSPIWNFSKQESLLHAIYEMQSVATT
jgi:hypothetical protein